MSDAIKIEQFDLSEKAELIPFLKVAYQDNIRQSDENFWNWHFIENPSVDLKKIPIWLAKNDEKIVGQLAAMPFTLKVADKETKAIWIIDFVVLPEFRRQGLGKLLVEKAQNLYPVTMALGTDEQHTPTLLKSLGWNIGNKISRYHKILFPGTAVREISKIKPLAKAVNFGFAPFRPRIDKNFLQNNKNLRLLEKFSSDFDDLWSEASKQWECAVKRDSQMLKWQYSQQPGKKFDILAFYENEKLRGYAVLFFRKADASNGSISKAAITDMVYHPDNAQKIIDELIKGALQLAVERRAGGLVTDVLNPLVEERLVSFGFWRVKNPLRLMVKTDFRKDLLYNAEKWYLTRGDSDISIFEDPNI